MKKYVHCILNAFQTKKKQTKLRKQWFYLQILSFCWKWPFSNMFRCMEFTYVLHSCIQKNGCVCILHTHITHQWSEQKNTKLKNLELLFYVFISILKIDGCYFSRNLENLIQMTRLSLWSGGMAFEWRSNFEFLKFGKKCNISSQLLIYD